MFNPALTRIENWLSENALGVFVAVFPFCSYWLGVCVGRWSERRRIGGAKI